MNIDLYNGDCLEIMKKVSDNSIDVVFTSPPYAERRKNSYNSIKVENYVEWFTPIAKEIKRVLKPTGSFFLNIKPHTEGGERSLYVFDLVLSLKRDLGFNFVDELCWIKNAFPGAYKGRFKNGFEPVYHFSKGKTTEITFNPVACGTPIKQESIDRAYRKRCGKPKNGSGMTGMNTTNIRHLKIARPDNVIEVNNVSNQFTLKSYHPATFPEGLVEFFVKSYSNEGDIVLDPFMGSGTTGVVCIRLNRNFIGMELSEEYFEVSEKRINKVRETLTQMEFNFKEENNE